MNSIIVKDSFYDSSIVQGLRLLYSKNHEFIVSTDIIADLVFPFCGNISFAILYPDNLNKDGIAKVTAISKVYDNFIVIVCISSEEATLYKHFLCAIPTNITALVCFPHDSFSKSTSTFIFDTVAEFKIKTRKLEKLLECERNSTNKHSLNDYIDKIKNSKPLQNEPISLIKHNKEAGKEFQNS